MSHRTIIDLKNGAPDIHAEHNGELHDVTEQRSNAEHLHDGSQKTIPGELPWTGLRDTDFSTAQAEGDAVNMDAVPVQYELHSNTKTHQLGGFYESYSALQ